MPFYNKIP